MEILWLVLIGFSAGALGSLLGLGGGFLVVPALIILKQVDPKIATGTSIAVIVPAMLVAMWQRGMRGHIDWPLAATIAAGAVVGPFLGAWLADHMPREVIRRVFAFVLIGLAALLFFKKDAPKTVVEEEGAAATQAPAAPPPAPR